MEILIPTRLTPPPPAIARMSCMVQNWDVKNGSDEAEMHPSVFEKEERCCIDYVRQGQSEIKIGIGYLYM